MTCEWCGAVIPTNSEAVQLENYAEGVYCCKDCARSALETQLDEVLEDNSYTVTIEDEDPYDNYGVSWGDFL